MPERSGPHQRVGRDDGAGIALAAVDAYGIFDALGDLVVSGPTFTNANDFRAMLIG